MVAKTPEVCETSGVFSVWEAAVKQSPFVAFCRKLPHVTEDIKWGADRVFSIGGKMFAAFHKDEPAPFVFKTTPENFRLLTKQAGIVPAPYAARFHWVSVQETDALPRDMIKELLREAYDLVAANLPRKTRKSLGLE